MLQVTLKVISETGPYGICADYMEDIADDICSYRHEQGEWSDDTQEIRQLQVLDEGEELEALYGMILYVIRCPLNARTRAFLFYRGLNLQAIFGLQLA